MWYTPSMTTNPVSRSILAAIASQTNDIEIWAVGMQLVLDLFKLANEGGDPAEITRLATRFVSEPEAIHALVTMPRAVRFRMATIFEGAIDAMVGEGLDETIEALGDAIALLRSEQG